MDRAIALWPLVVLGLVCVLASGCASARRDSTEGPGSPTRARPAPSPRAAPPSPTTTERPSPATLTGRASWYGEPHHGQKTASGELYDMHKMTAAHRTLPFGTRLRVTHLDTGRSVVVRVNDRGPHIADRIVDLSYAAAQALGTRGAGVFAVSIEVLDDGPSAPPSTPASR